MDELLINRDRIDKKSKEILSCLKKNYTSISPQPQTIIGGVFRHVFSSIKSFTITDELPKLLKERLRLVIATGQYKQRHGISSFKYLRELEILQSVMRYASKNKLPVYECYIIFREIISACLQQELQHAKKSLQVAFLGPKMTYSHIAAKICFGSSVSSLMLPTVSEVIAASADSHDIISVVPIENSTSGTMTQHMDMVSPQQNFLYELHLPIIHSLVGSCSNFSAIKEIYAHQQSLLQCRKWLDTNLSHAKQIATSSNSDAVRKIRKRSQSVAIASKQCAEYFSQNIIRSAIQDYPLNATRFAIIGKKPKVWNSDILKFKSSLLVSLPHTPGSLSKLLDSFSEINFTKIESRPDPHRPFRYNFYLDCEGHQDDKPLSAKIKQLRLRMLKNYGSYPSSIVSQELIRNAE